MPDDFELLRRWRGGDTVAGQELFSKHIGGIARFFHAKAPAEVDDLVQKTFMACVEGRERFREEGSFKAFLYGTARHILYAHFRQRRREEAEGGGPPPRTATSPSGVLVRAQEHKLLLAALRRLPLDLQIALEMTYWEGMTMRELAAVLEIPPGTVASRLRRAREKLAEELEALDASEALIRSTTTDLGQWAERLRLRLASDSSPEG